MLHLYFVTGIIVQLSIIVLRLMLHKPQSYLKELYELHSKKEWVVFVAVVLVSGFLNVLIWPITIYCEIFNTKNNL